MPNTLTLAQAAQMLNRTPKTLQRWDREKVLIAHRTVTGRRYYTEDQIRTFLGAPAAAAFPRNAVAYCRVSSQAQRPDLKNQRARLEEFCASRGMADVEFLAEISGGLNFKRKVFLSIVHRITRNEISHLILAHKDRMVRFGFALIEDLCREHEVEILVLNNETLSPEQEVVQDLMTIIHCFSSRLYGLRKYKKSLQIALTEKNPDANPVP